MPDDGRRQATPEPFIAAAVQRPPAFLDLAAAVGSAVDAVAEAAGEGARLIVFPETWLPTYPYWHAMVSERAAYSDLYQRLFKSSLSVPGPDFDRLAAAARRAAATVVIGVNEREEAGGTIYNTLCYIGPDGHLLGKHRKLVPTLSERLIWGRGDGSDLDVYDTPVGRLGGLICYEHQMAPARYALATLGIEVHASVWPGREFLHPIVDAATRHLAYENGCFVVVAREIFSAALLPAGTPLAEAPVWEGHGGSAIIAPGGKYLAGPVYDEETIVYAEIDLDATIESNRWVDTAGHFSRPDVFQLRWDRRPKAPVEVVVDPDPDA